MFTVDSQTDNDSIDVWSNGNWLGGPSACIDSEHDTRGKRVTFTFEKKNYHGTMKIHIPAIGISILDSAPVRKMRKSIV